MRCRPYEDRTDLDGGGGGGGGGAGDPEKFVCKSKKKAQLNFLQASKKLGHPLPLRTSYFIGSEHNT